MIFGLHEHSNNLVRSIYGSCALSSFWLGILLNILLIWLILTRTPAPMQMYRKLLLTPCFMCILLAIATFLVQPIPIVHHGFHAVIQNGPVSSLPQPWNYTANVAWFQMLLLFVCSTTVQFAFRYYMVSRTSDGQIPLKLKYLTGFLVYILLVAHVALHYWSDYPYEEYKPSMAQLARMVNAELGITEIHFSSFTWARSWSWILHCIAMVGVFVMCYWIIVVCGTRTQRHVAQLYGANKEKINRKVVKTGTKIGQKKKKHEKKQNGHHTLSNRVIDFSNTLKKQRLRAYNQQVTVAFFVQAVLPTIEVIELTVQTTLPILLASTHTIHYMVYAAIPLYFIPVLNPLVTMLLVKPYQMAVLKMLGLHSFGRRSSKLTKMNGGKGGRGGIHQQFLTPQHVQPQRLMTSLSTIT